MHMMMEKFDSSNFFTFPGQIQLVEIESNPDRMQNIINFIYPDIKDYLSALRWGNKSNLCFNHMPWRDQIARFPRKLSNAQANNLLKYLVLCFLLFTIIWMSIILCMHIPVQKHSVQLSFVQDSPAVRCTPAESVHVVHSWQQPRPSGQPRNSNLYLTWFL